MLRLVAGLILGVGALGLAACSSDTASTASGSGSGGSSSSSGSGGSSSGSGGGSASSGGTGGSSSVVSSSSSTAASSGSGGGAPATTSCSDPVPAGAAEAADPRPYSGGTCPMLVQGHNPGFMSGGVARDFVVLSPSNAMPGEQFPVIFFWHWLGGSADDFVNKGELATAVDQQRFIAVAPESIGANVAGLPFDVKWPFDISQPQSRIDQEFEFFDDMLACVSQQFPVNKNCVSSAGVSAGALFTGQLIQGRSEYLSSFLSLSGGTGGNIIRPFTGAQHKLPGIVLWGGPTDNCFSLLNFEQCSNDLENGLTQDGHFFIECIHNCGHAQPPIDVAPGESAFAPLWNFVFAHPFWLKAGDSPWKGGLPAGYVPWCGIGQGSATPRTGTCPDPPGC